MRCRRRCPRAMRRRPPRWTTATLPFGRIESIAARRARRARRLSSRAGRNRNPARIVANCRAADCVTVSRLVSQSRSIGTPRAMVSNAVMQTLPAMSVRRSRWLRPSWQTHALHRREVEVRAARGLPNRNAARSSCTPPTVSRVSEPTIRGATISSPSASSGNTSETWGDTAVKPPSNEST